MRYASLRNSSSLSREKLSLPAGGASRSLRRELKSGIRSAMLNIDGVLRKGYGRAIKASLLVGWEDVGASMRTDDLVEDNDDEDNFHDFRLADFIASRRRFSAASLQPVTIPLASVARAVAKALERLRKVETIEHSTRAPRS